MSDTRDRVEAGWREWEQAIAGIPEARLSDPGVDGDWSVKDVLGHLAFWEDAAVRMIERELAGEPRPEGNTDFEPINQREAAAHADWTLARARQELADTHARLLAALDRLPNVDPDLIEGNAWEHYQEHAGDVRAWRERVGL